jgi:hypothetical protein
MILAQTPACRQRTKRLSQVVYGPRLFGRPRHGVPDRKSQKIPIEDPAIIHPWHAARLIGQHRLDGSPFLVGEFVAHDGSRLGSQLQRALGQRRFGRDAPESGRIVLTLSSSAYDPSATSAAPDEAWLECHFRLFQRTRFSRYDALSDRRVADRETKLQKRY